ncbi:hypothetical protein [Roseomonas sp. HF4]|uniref:hypothetical protein n=1 Tax=Roseomonas sp. HF4 TaxID=2562313 RepID=UPI0010BFFFCD|nr:hypothetical protein [Roseomonas sp. HF4]
MNDAHPRTGRPFLLLAHPGHELRLFGWMERHRPVVFILSDGSGGAARSRIAHSLATIGRAGAEAGEVFGQMSDIAWYAAMLARDAAPFLRVADAMTAAALRHRPPILVSDAVDGHNPLHDLCEAIGAGVARRAAADGLDLRHLASAATASAIGEEAEAWEIGAAVADRKRAAVAAYAPLAEEAARIMAAEPDALRVERLLAPGFPWPEAWEPGWEAFGRRRVAEGRFPRAITYAEHVRPIAQRLLAGVPAMEPLA